jgi:hypothetical protein
MRRLAFRTISQIGIRYPQSALSEGAAGGVRGGDRLPWVGPELEGAGDNFDPLATMAWQVHVYGEPSPALSPACERLGLPLNAFPWRPAMGRKGLRRGAVYLVRPDGYVALADPEAVPGRLARYFEARGLSPARPAADRARSLA